MSVQKIIGSLTTKDSFVDYKDFEERLKEQVQDDIPMSDLHELLKFTSDQYGYWVANWYFSPETKPDLKAKNQSEGWELLWQAFFLVLIKYVPDAEEKLHREHDRIASLYSLQRRVDYNETKSIERIMTIILSKTAIILNSIGFKTTARDMYAKSLYPKGSVGRVV